MALPSQSERTFQMLKNFLQLRDQGLSIKEIAYKFNLDTSTVYRNLDRVVQQYNATHPDTPITRESLLERPHSPHVPHEYSYALLAPVDIVQFRKDLSDMLRGVDALLVTIASDILGQEMLNLRL